MKQFLIAARDLIKNPKDWCQKQYALDKYNEVCSPDSPEACRWCATGAFFRAVLDIEERAQAMKVLYKIAEKMYPGSVLNPIVLVNDKGTHADVMEMFRLAIGEEQ